MRVESEKNIHFLFFSSPVLQEMLLPPFLTWLHTTVTASSIPVRVIFSPLFTDSQKYIGLHVIEEKCLVRSAYDMTKTHFLSKISHDHPVVIESLRQNCLVIPSISADFLKNYSSLYYFLQEASSVEILAFFTEIISEMKRLVSRGPVALHFHGADEPILHARIVPTLDNDETWIRKQRCFDSTLPFLDLSLMEFFAMMWKIHGGDPERVYQHLRNVYGYHCYEMDKTLLPPQSLFLIRYEGNNHLVGNWTDDSRSTVIHADWSLGEFIILRQLLRKGVHSHIVMEDLLADNTTLPSYPLVCIVQRKIIPFAGVLTLKVDGQLTGVSLYRPQTREFDLVNAYIDRLPSNSFYHVLRKTSMENHQMLMVIHSQRTFLMGLDSYPPRQNDKRWSWILGAIAYGCLQLPIQKTMPTLEEVIPLFFSMVIRQIQGMNTDFSFLTLSFEAICAHRRCPMGILHRDITVDSPCHRLVFLGISLMPSGAKKATFLAHHECPIQGVFEQPMTWTDPYMTGEKILSIISHYKEYYLEDGNTFVGKTKPAIYNPHKDPEGFILYGDQHQFLKIKTRAFIDAFTQNEKSEIMIESNILAVYPFFRKMTEFDNKYQQIMTIMRNLIMTPNDFQRVYQEHGLEIFWCSSLCKNYSIGILNMHVGDSRVLKTTLEYIALSNPSKLAELISQFIKTYRHSFIHEPAEWRDLWFRSCELL